MAAKVKVFNKNTVKDVDVYELKNGDVVKSYEENELIVCGETYDDGIDDMVVCKDENGNVHHMSPLLLE